MVGRVGKHQGGPARHPAGLQVAQRTAGVNCNVLLPSGPGAFEPVSNQSHMTGIPVAVTPAGPIPGGAH